MKVREIKHRKFKLWQVIIFALILGIFIIGGLGVPLKAATAPLTIKNMKVSVWPEYDNGRILVMYEGEFNNAENFPGDVTFLTPQNIEIGQVCAIQNGTEHLCQLYTTGSENGLLTINYNLPIPTFYLEYYYDGIAGSVDKNIDYQFKSLYKIDNLQVVVQQPLRSSAFAVTPAANFNSTDAQGFKYYNFNFQDVAPDEVIPVTASYNKQDSNPSVNPGKTQSGQSTGSNLPLVFGVVGGVVLLVAAFFLLSRTRRPVRQAAVASRANFRQKPVPGRAQAKAPQTSGKSVSFCPYCGHDMGRDYRFCPGCGADIEKHRK